MLTTGVFLALQANIPGAKVILGEGVGEVYVVICATADGYTVMEATLDPHPSFMQLMATKDPYEARAYYGMAVRRRRGAV